MTPSPCSQLSVAWLTPPMIQLLVERGLNLYAIDESGRNALHLAFTTLVVPPPETIEYLLRAGVPLNARDRMGKTPLAYWREPRDFERRSFSVWLFERLGDGEYYREQRANRARVTELLERAGAGL